MEYLLCFYAVCIISGKLGMYVWSTDMWFKEIYKIRNLALHL